MVTARFPPLIGGTEAHVAEVSARLAARGYRVSVVTTVAKPAEKTTAEENGVEVIRLPANHVWSDVYLPRKLGETIRSIEADLVHVQGYHTLVAPIAMRAARRMGTPYVLTFHSGGHDSRFRRVIRPVQRKLLRPALNGARELIAVSDYERRIFARALRVTSESITVIPTGVDEAFFSVDRRRDRTATHVLSAGRLVAYKGHQLVIDAMPAIRRVVPEARLRILGDGPDRALLQARVDALGLHDAVDFVVVPPSDRMALAREFAVAGVVTVMSSYESQGLVGYEAAATGARMVIARGTALDELGAYPGVEIVERGDAGALVAAIVSQLRAEPLSDRPAVPQIGETVDRLQELYARALANRPGPHSPAS